MHGPSGAASLSASSPRARQRTVSPVDLLITAAFAIVLIAQISRHDMWRDEIHSWGLVLASPTLPDLFANLRFTGHPGLWYVILWLVSFFTASPFTIQIVHACIAISLIGMIGLFSPFSRLERLLLLASYFVLFEYTVISRNYGLGFLIALAFAQMRAMRPERLYVNALLLGLLANTNMFAFVLAGAFALEYLVDLWLRRQGKPLGAFAREVLPPALLYAAFAAGSIATMWPSPDISWRTTGPPLAKIHDISWLLDTIAGNIAALLPLLPLNYWNSRAPGTVYTATAALLPALAFLFFFIFRSNLRLLIIPGLTALGSISICEFVYGNSIRHWGIHFVAFIATLWIQRVWAPQRSWLVLGLLAVNAYAGIAISVQQFPLTFSEGRHTAEWIRANGFANDALVGTPDTLAVVVAQYLSRPIYFLDCSCTDIYLYYNKRRDGYDSTQIPDRLARAVHELERRRILFIISRPLRDAEQAALLERGVAVAPLASFDKAATDENFFLYRVGRAPPPA